MNYQNFASYSAKPAYYGKEFEALYDRGQGIPAMDETNMTVQDIFRTPFLFLQEHRKNYGNMASTALKGIQNDSELARLYFSDTNMKRLQRMIKQAVFERTNGQFRLDVDQEQRDLLIMMRSVYLEQARFLPNSIVRQCKKLNAEVVKEALPGILTEIRQYYGYLREINKPLTPIPREQNVSNKGRNLLPSITTTWY